MYRRIMNFIAVRMYERKGGKEQKERLKVLWAIAYGVIGWNVFTLTIYSVGKDGGAGTKEGRERLLKKLAGEDGQVSSYHIHGLTYVGKETVSLKDGSIKESYRSPRKEESGNSEEFKWPSKQLITWMKDQDEMEEVVDN